MINHLDVPDEFNKNATNVAALGAEITGAKLIELAMHLAGLTTPANSDVLDVGCGVRFTESLINRGIPIGSIPESKSIAMSSITLFARLDARLRRPGKTLASDQLFPEHIFSPAGRSQMMAKNCNSNDAFVCTNQSGPPGRRSGRGAADFSARSCWGFMITRRGAGS